MHKNLFVTTNIFENVYIVKELPQIPDLKLAYSVLNCVSFGIGIRKHYKICYFQPSTIFLATGSHLIALCLNLWPGTMSV